MQEISEAIQGEYHFIVSDTYVAVTLGGQEMVHLTRDEAKEITHWLSKKLNCYQGEIVTQLVNPINPVNNKEKTPDPMADRRASSSEGQIDRSGVNIMDLGKDVKVSEPKHIKWLDVAA